MGPLAKYTLLVALTGMCVAWILLRFPKIYKVAGWPGPHAVMINLIAGLIMLLVTGGFAFDVASSGTVAARPSPTPTPTPTTAPISSGSEAPTVSGTRGPSGPFFLSDRDPAGGDKPDRGAVVLNGNKLPNSLRYTLTGEVGRSVMSTLYNTEGDGTFDATLAVLDALQPLKFEVLGDDGTRVDVQWVRSSDPPAHVSESIGRFKQIRLTLAFACGVGEEKVCGSSGTAILANAQLR